MKISGTFIIKSHNIVTGETKEVEKGNVITNKFYRDILVDDSNSSIGIYLWTSPFQMQKTRRRTKIEATPMFLNDAYGYIPSGDWFARYNLSENNMPGYFESRCRFDPPATGTTRTIRSILMTGTKPRVDSVTGLLPEYANNSIIDYRTSQGSVSVSKMNIYAFVTLDSDCIQSDSEVFDIYYRLIFDNNYSDTTLTETAIELLGKQSTAKMPSINRSGNIIKTTVFNIPAFSSSGPVNFTTSTIVPAGISPTNGDLWHDYGNVFPSTKTTNGYVTNYSVDMGKDYHVGKIIGTTYMSGYLTAGLLSGYGNINTSEKIGNTHSHSITATKPFFDPSGMARGNGYCTMSHTQDVLFPELITLKIEESGSYLSAKYSISKYPFTGFYKNTYQPLTVDAPHLSNLVINNGSWRGGINYESIDNMSGFLTGKPGTHPSFSGISYLTSDNPVPLLGRIADHDYSGLRELSEYEILGYDKSGISIFTLNGNIRRVNSVIKPQFGASNITQIEFDKTTKDIYVACKNSGLYKLNSQLTIVSKINPSYSTGEKCYGVDIFENKMVAIMNDGVFYSTNSGVSWTLLQNPDYTNNGLDREKIIGVRADLTSITPNLLLLFSNKDGLETTEKNIMVAAWVSPTIFNPITVKPQMQASGVSPSFIGIDYILFNNGKFYTTFNGETSAFYYGTYIGSILFNSTLLTKVISLQNSETDGIPKWINKNNKDYIIIMSGQNIFIKNITDNTQHQISSYGNTTGYITALNITSTPYYYCMMSNGLVLIRVKSEYVSGLSNGSLNPNIVNDVIRENANILTTKVINPFFNSQYRDIFEKKYGWDGVVFSENSYGQNKSINSNDNNFLGTSIDFTAIGLSDDFYSGDYFTAIKSNFPIKDNSSTGKIFMSNSNFFKSNRITQTGTIEENSAYYKVKRFEEEECNISYTDSHYLIDSRSTPYDYMYTSKIPQQAGSFKILHDSLLKHGYAVLFDVNGIQDSYSCSFGLMIYKSASTYKMRVTSYGPTYNRSSIIAPNTSYQERVIQSGDTIEITWTTSSSRRLFSLKHNGTVLYTGINFDGSYDSTNNSQLSVFYVPLSSIYTDQDSVITVPIPEVRSLQTDKIIPVQLSAFMNDKLGLSINGDNYGEGGDVTVYINSNISENTGINTVAPPLVDNNRSILVGNFASSNKSGEVFFSKNDEGKTYTVEYIYYKDTE